MKHSNISIFIPHSGCPHMCSFCNQNVISGQNKAPTLDEVEHTLSIAMQDITQLEDRKNTEIAFFGGSFTAISREYMIQLLKIACRYVEEHSLMGIRISTRPDAISNEILTILKEYKVTSIELGVQSLDDRVLKLNNRGHTLDDVYRAVDLIKKYKFSLGLQMMIGLYEGEDGDYKESVYFTANTIVKLKPDTVRIYPTVILRGTKLAQLYEDKKYKPMNLDEAIECTANIIFKFHQNEINIIKVGLHASEDVKKDMVAGLYHPAFRELCESKIYNKLLNDALSLLEKGEYNVYVNGRDTSKLVGQKRSNFKQFFNQGYKLNVKNRDNLKDFVIEVERVI